MNNDASQKKKTILIVVAAVVSLVVIVTLLRSVLSSSTPSREQIGLFPLSMEDENGDTWVLNLAKGQSLSGFEDSSEKPGPPLMVRTDVQAAGRQLSIGLIIEGQAGESYQPGVMKNGSIVPPPSFKVTDESGKVVGSGQFHYG